VYKARTYVTEELVYHRKKTAFGANLFMTIPSKDLGDKEIPQVIWFPIKEVASQGGRAHRRPDQKKKAVIFLKNFGWVYFTQAPKDRWELSVRQHSHHRGRWHHDNRPQTANVLPCGTDEEDDATTLVREEENSPHARPCCCWLQLLRHDELWWIVFSETPLVSILVVVLTLSFLKKLFIVLAILGRREQCGGGEGCIQSDGEGGNIATAAGERQLPRRLAPDRYGDTPNQAAAIFSVLCVSVCKCVWVCCMVSKFPFFAEENALSLQQ
jgi:hypothetical protein